MILNKETLLLLRSAAMMLVKQIDRILLESYNWTPRESSKRLTNKVQ